VLVSFGLDQQIEDLAFGVDGSPYLQTRGFYGLVVQL
jgi:hypothetical protein